MSWMHGAILSLTYLVLGKLGLMLAVEPGFASPIFPPAGIALAAAIIFGKRSWFWIFLGSTLLNIWIGAGNSISNINSIGIGAALGIALASTLQAVIGATLIHKFIPSPLMLTQNGELVRFTLLLPISALTSCTLSITILFLLNIVPSHAFMSNWLNWWLGDWLGMLVFGLIGLTLLAKPRDLWRYRITTVCLPIFCTLIFFVLAYTKTNEWEYEQSLSDFQQQSKQLKQNIENRLSEQDALLEQTARLFVIEGKNSTSDQHFHRFLLPALKRYHYIQSIEWAPLITQPERPNFEHEQRAHLSSFTIHDEQAIRSTQLDYHYPVSYVVPMTGNTTRLGFDLASQPNILSAIQDAIRNNKLTNAPPIRQPNTVQQTNLILIHPVSSAQIGSDILLSTLNMNLLFTELLKNKGIHLRFKDTDSNTLIFDNIPQQQNATLSQHELQFGGRHYLLETAPSIEYLNQHPLWQGMVVFATGVFFISLLTSVLLLGTGYTARIQQQVKERTKELSAHREHTEAILNNVLDGIITVDQQGDITYSNNTAQHMFAYSAQAFMQQTIANLFNGPLQQTYIDFFSGNSSVKEFVSQAHELNGVTQTGTIFPIEVVISEMLREQNVFYNLVIRDISERKQMDQMKSEFISTVSHELRTPLTAIQGAIGLLNHASSGLPNTSQTLLAVALRNCERLALLINDLLDSEKLSSGKINLEMKYVELIPQIQLALDNNRTYASQYKISYLLCDEIGQAYVYVDCHRLQQVLSNLLSNAAKFSFPNSNVHISIKRYPPFIRISICNTGKPIPESFRQRIFKPFEQVDSSDSRQKGGTGLGLNISKSLVEKMDGRIDYESTQGNTVFFIEFLEHHI